MMYFYCPGRAHNLQSFMKNVIQRPDRYETASDTPGAPNNNYQNVVVVKGLHGNFEIGALDGNCGMALIHSLTCGSINRSKLLTLLQDACFILQRAHYGVVHYGISVDGQPEMAGALKAFGFKKLYQFKSPRTSRQCAMYMFDLTQNEIKCPG